jgi:hypothetical protein
MRIVRADEQGPGQPGLLNAEGQTLAPGDLIVTGTPASVRMGRALEMSVTGLAAQRHTVIVS